MGFILLELNYCTLLGTQANPTGSTMIVYFIFFN